VNNCVQIEYVLKSDNFCVNFEKCSFLTNMSTLKSIHQKLSSIELNRLTIK
jgi:hypothetical protein